MSNFNQLKQMLITVAEGLGPDLINEVAFVGGCTTGLHVTDPYTQETVRYTDDVDLIINVAGYLGWHNFQEKLQQHGFKLSMDDGDVICRMRLGELKVDFMPDDAEVLGFSNRWYKEALDTTVVHSLTNTIDIRLITAPYFVATKLEAYKGRGNNDPLESRDVEDILTLFDGREELVGEIAAGSALFQAYISENIAALLAHSDFDYAVQSTAQGDAERQNLIFQRLEATVLVEQ